MTAYKGRSLTVKLGTAAAGVIISQCRTHTIRVNHELVDITNKDSNGFRTLLEDAGTKSISISIEGIVDNSTVFESLQSNANTGAISTYAITGLADSDTLEGNFLLANFEASGAYNGEQTFTCTLESSGAWTYTSV